MGFFQRETPLVVKFITSAPPYRLNNLETRISGFFRKSNAGFLEHLSEHNYSGNPAPIGKLLCLGRNQV